MARPFPNTFEQDSPMTPQSASSISYQTNVNRQKTKKWAEAKTVNYGGDDWGDDDEYDVPPPPISKPTGFRQQGQGIQSSAKPESPGFDSAKKYGELPPLPGANDPRGRRNSFDADDEKRNFSSSTMRQPSPAAATPTSATSAGPATRFSQITGQPSARNASGPPALSIQTQQPQAPTGLRKQSQMVSPVSGSPHPDVLQPGRVNQGESSVVSPASETPSTASDFQARRDFSPSAVPQPLNSRASPAPQSATDSPSTRFPARKSSLSQAMGPPVSEIMRPSPADTTPKPWVSGRSASPGASARSPGTPTGKALPFIRPADIYRRAEEERRQSLESGRPSMDSVTGAKSSDRSDSPAMPQVREKSSSDSLGGTGRRRTSFEGDEGSDSGRRLMPMLEPVRERKSEYGFEGVNLGEQPPQTGPVHSTQSFESATDLETDEEEARRLSISPKLPDLTRMSGFGMDMFSQPSTDAPKAPTTRDAGSVPTTSTTTLSPVDEDLKLRTQPSFGFKSVVNQAFDRSDDASVPPTPASNTGSGPRRTDSESTGTTGISPIMSRVPSGAGPDSRHRDISNPTILEVVNEPISPETAPSKDIGDEQRGREIPGFKPGYRRDISTPRSDNSPARTPDLAKARIITSGQHAVVSETSPEMEPAESEPLQPPRPIAEREGSFRPSLPGGWTSYATTAQSENPSQAPSVRAHTPIRDVSTANNQGRNDESDLTPTTTKHGMPASELGAAVAGTASLALRHHDNNSLATGHIPPSRTPSRKAVPSNSALPTPDPAMAPGGNLYSTKDLDPRLLPKLEQAPAETQLRPDADNRDVSAQSSVAPTPPLKDTPENDGADDDSEYFATPPVPLKPRTPVQAEEHETLAPPMRPQMLPALSTDTYANDEENDKLRQEIVKSLTPRPSDGNAHDDGVVSDEFDETNYPKQGHESTYLPREYDNYWASNSDDEEQVPETAPAPVEDPVKKEISQPETIEQEHNMAESPIVAPLSPRKPEQSSLQPPRPPMQSRFSWEDSNENVNAIPSNDQVSEVSATSSPVHISHMAEDTNVAPTTTLSTPQQSALDVNSVEPPVQEIQPGHSSTEDHNTNALLAAVGAASLTAAAIPRYDSTPLENKSRRLSLAEEKDPRVSSHPVSPTPPEDEHPARAAQSYFSPSPNQNSPVPAPSTVSPVASPVHQQPFAPPLGPILGFKNIVQIPSSQERIEAFNTTRQRFAIMDSGLNNWMVALQQQHPEHAGAGASFGGSRFSVPSGTGRSKFGRSTGGTAPPLQQPYYQQYLNASSPTMPSTPVGPRPGPGPSMTSGSQQGFNSNSSKITSQQVQAKGKELLHSAGIFGGKAGKAGKGLLAKGKSKFRSGGDKTSPPPKPKAEQPKQERRTSWGLPLNLSRSSIQQDGSARQSKESIPQSNRPRAATTTSNRSFAAPQLPDVSTGESLGVMSGALPSMNGEQEQQRPEPATIRQVQQAEEESEARDSLGVPAPIGKHQPSWDPYNATPIAEEEGFQYEERPKQRQLPSDVGNRHGSLGVPLGAKSSSERSNSGDTHFYSAHEEESDIPHDWVMVSPIPESSDAFPNVSPPEGLKPVANVESDNRKSLDAPVTSIINRPRGSSYEIPSPPPSAKGPTPRSVQSTPVAAAPVQFTPSPPKPVQAEPEKQTASTSFLPPIRRTSTFGLGFGPRQAKPRFPLEDEDEHSVPENPVNPTPTKPIEQLVRPAASKPTLLQEQVRTSSSIPVPAPGPSAESISPPTPERLASKPVAAQSPRPLSFVQTFGAGEVLHTPFRHAEQRPVVDEAFLHNPPRYAEASQPREELRQQPPREQPQSALSKETAPAPSSPPRPQLTQAGSSEYSQKSAQSQRTVLPQQVMQQKAMNSGSPESMQRIEQNQRVMGPPPASQQHFPPLAPRASDVLQRPEFRESQVEWRLNRPKTTEPPAQVSPTFWKEVDVPAPRHSNSWEPQRPRGNSGASPSYSQRPDGQYNERPGWNGPPAQQSPYQQPPSSAQRYPDLFRPGQAGPDASRDSADLPAHYYQAPITRADAFLPRQQTNEYQIPGVGPPSDDPRYGSSKRNSGFFKEIGGKLSRASSRERRNSVTRDGAPAPASPVRQFESRGNEYAESSVASEGEQEQRKRRSSFFGHLSRNSTSGLGPPQSRESVIAHNSASRTDLVASPQPSPTHQEKKRSFFGSSSKDPKEKANKLVRTPTGSVEASGKKNRFSGLSTMFGKTSPSPKGPVQERPQATRELSYNERQPIESPQMNAQRPSMNTPPPRTPRAPSQTRQVLQKLTSSTSPRSSPRPDAKTRRTSSSGLLGGLIGRRSNQQDRGSDDSRSQGSSSQARTITQALPPAQTYSDLHEEQPRPPPPQQQRREMPFQDPSMQLADRGRQASREPQYDSVPIPGGYSLVRGQGAVPVATDYDPRGFNRVQQQPIDPRYPQGAPNGHFLPNGVPTQAPPQQFVNDQRYGPGPRTSPPVSQESRQLLQPKPHLGALETYENYTNRAAPRRLSREDLLARSPPKSLEGQQRPYQISLPGGDEDERPAPLEKDHPAPTSNPTLKQVRPQHDAIQRLQQPMIRHPESPAGYPLPEDTVFSPVNPGVNDIPPPPPPQWPGRQESQRSDILHQHLHTREASLSTMDGDLDRSNTRRTAMSAVSGLSGPQSGNLNVPDRQISDATETDRDRRHIASPSPSPPSPMPGTPDRNITPGDDIRTTEINSKRSKEDLYNASPRLPKQGHMLPRELTQISTSNATPANRHLQPEGKENMNVGRSFSAAVPPTTEYRADGHVTRAASSSQAEEKIAYRDGVAGRAELPVAGDDDEPEMSAVSYPGMEWNPYAAGAWDDGYD